MLKIIQKLSSSQAKIVPLRLYNQMSGPTATTTTTTVNQPPINSNVPGLSENCVAVPQNPVGPNAGKNTDYKNPEYFCYHVDSFAEAEVEMAKYRLPPPNNKEKFTRNL